MLGDLYGCDDFRVLNHTSRRTHNQTSTLELEVVKRCMRVSKFGNCKSDSERHPVELRFLLVRI